MQERFGPWRTTRDIHVHGHGGINATARGEGLPVDSTTDRAGAYSDNKLWIRRRLICFSESDFHVTCNGPCHQQHVGMPRRGNKVHAEPLDIVDRIAESRDLDLASVAGTGVYLPDMERTTKQRIDSLFKLCSDLLNRTVV